MTVSTADYLLDNGLLQFGRFDFGGQNHPIRLSLELICAYPDVLEALTGAVQSTASNTSADRLLVPDSMIAFGGALSLKTGLPLIYSRGRGEDPVYDLVGAYNAGHRILVVVPDEVDLSSGFLNSAQRVGLVVVQVIILVAMHRRPVEDASGLNIQSLYTLGELVRDLTGRGRVPTSQAEIVLDWLGDR